MLVPPGDIVQFIGAAEDSCDLSTICSGHVCNLLSKNSSQNIVSLMTPKCLCIPKCICLWGSLFAVLTRYREKWAPDERSRQHSGCGVDCCTQMEQDESHSKSEKPQNVFFFCWAFCFVLLNLFNNILQPSQRFDITSGGNADKIERYHWSSASAPRETQPRGGVISNLRVASQVILIARKQDFWQLPTPAETLIAMKEKTLSLARGIAPRSWPILG